MASATFFLGNLILDVEALECTGSLPAGVFHGNGPIVRWRGRGSLPRLTACPPDITRALAKLGGIQSRSNPQHSRLPLVESKAIEPKSSNCNGGARWMDSCGGPTAGASSWHGLSARQVEDA